MSNTSQRLRRVIAAMLPLIVLALVLLALEFTIDRRPSIEQAWAGTVIFGLGPLALFAVPKWPLGVAVAASVVIWSAYALVIAFTRLGTASAWTYAILSTVWLGVGFVSTMYAGLAV